MFARGISNLADSPPGYGGRIAGLDCEAIALHRTDNKSLSVVATRSRARGFSRLRKHTCVQRRDAVLLYYPPLRRRQESRCEWLKAASLLGKRIRARARINDVTR